MKISNRLSMIALTFLMAFLWLGCFSRHNNPGSESPIRIILYSDEERIAERVKLYLEEEPDFQITSTDDIQTLSSMNLREHDVVILLPLRKPQLPVAISLSLDGFVKTGGGIIGMHDVILEQDMLSQVFGGKAKVFPEDAYKPKLKIAVREGENSPLVKGIPEQFILAHEHPFGAEYNSEARCLFEMSYKDLESRTKRYCGGWLYEYGEGKSFYFAPGHLEETRYNPYVLKILTNAARWMAEQMK